MNARSTFLIDKLGDDYGAAVAWFRTRVPDGAPAMPLRLLSDPKLRIDTPDGREFLARQAARYDWPTDTVLILSPLPMFLLPSASESDIADALAAINDELPDVLIVVVQPVGTKASDALPGWVLATEWDVVWARTSESRSEDHAG